MPDAVQVDAAITAEETEARLFVIENALDAAFGQGAMSRQGEVEAALTRASAALAKLAECEAQLAPPAPPTLIGASLAPGASWFGHVPQVTRAGTSAIVS